MSQLLIPPSEQESEQMERYSPNARYDPALGGDPYPISTSIHGNWLYVTDEVEEMIEELRQQRKAAAQNARPVFGPRPSQAIFRAKWLRKFNAIWADWPPARYFTRPMRSINWLSNAFENLHAFRAEGTALGFFGPNKDEELQVGPVKQMEGHPWEKAFVFECPLRAWYMLGGHVNLRCINVVQAGDPVPLGCTDPPALQKEYREAANRWIARMVEATDAGEWYMDLPEEIQKHIKPRGWRVQKFLDDVDAGRIELFPFGLAGLFEASRL